MMNQAPILSLSSASYAFGDDGMQVFSDISLSIHQGAFVALVGASGIGKSTLLRVIAGLLPVTSGEVLLDGVPPKQAETPVGIVFQKDNLMPWRTAYENVRLPLELRGENGQSESKRVQDMLQLVGLADFAGSYPAQLSGGMAQRVAIARALVHRPELLLLDEPFGSLDALTRERMGEELLRIWQAMPVTVFMVTHSIDEAVFLADEVLVMGSISGNGLPSTITHRFPIPIARPRHFDMRKRAAFAQREAAIRHAIQSQS